MSRPSSWTYIQFFLTFFLRSLVGVLVTLLFSLSSAFCFAEVAPSAAVETNAVLESPLEPVAPTPLLLEISKPENENTKIEIIPSQTLPAPMPSTEEILLDSTTLPKTGVFKPAPLSTPALSSIDTQLQHEVIRRIVAFPLETQGNFKKEADEAWWKIRDILSEQQRFLVATKRLLSNKNAFSSRSFLTVPDVSVLSKALESDCILTTFIDGKDLQMIAYSRQDGLPLWKKSILFNSGKPISQQLVELSEKLIRDFIASIPYHGFQIIDPISDKPLQYDSNLLIAKIDVGAKSTILPGEKVQWLNIERVNVQPLFLGGATYSVYAEGMVLKNENQILTVEVKRYSSLEKLNKKSMILVNEESKRLISKYGIKDANTPEVSLSFVENELKSNKVENPEKKSLLTALLSIVNIVVVVLLAF